MDLSIPMRTDAIPWGLEHSLEDSCNLKGTQADMNHKVLYSHALYRNCAWVQGMFSP